MISKTNAYLIRSRFQSAFFPESLIAAVLIIY